MEILETPYDEWVGYLKTHHGKGAFHASALVREVMVHGNPCFGDSKAFREAPALAAALAGEVRFTPPVVEETVCEDGVVKVLHRLADGLAVESVVIPMKGYATLCLSTQVGCRMGCRFCRTGRMGLRRNLTVAEMTGQLWNARFVLKAPIRNLVFMGMGEPLDNLENVVRAVGVMTDIRGFSIGPKRITVSTVGLADQMTRLADANLGVRLALSLNASDDAVRSTLMPVNRRYPLAVLKETLGALAGHKGLRDGVLLEYVLIRGVNDRPEDAKRLAGFVSGLTATLNLIPFNPSKGETELTAPCDADVNAFHDQLVARGLHVRRRWSQGEGLLAACGQLGEEACRVYRLP
ncbi:23S rRNA (adenine(2503)-C(2))-methyltransferase RlmN [Desulfoluna spongiiphila]|uniref:23S rRNA m(2)A-2503 methyltransferase n=1 Tax=Desulfoluna spongiiphila TaxID=419481 RepID=A0A1G5B039_9BACT|nr:23S rRNA (adenine(2503)-C(2))-methyltransferase RlmN [Desulfoluna spongiiphila]SCX83450.1 23S rRNA m(2)A-2503 methyltransferase [Desulfoluna spongiiphila]